MTNRRLLLLALAVWPTVLPAQNTPQRRFVRAMGEATVAATPDQARVSVGVTIQDRTAQAAADKNAAQVKAVLAAVRQVLGAGADIRTVQYSLHPNYNSPRDNTPPMLTGYTASNVVEATINDLALVGRTIDAATQAGANRVESLQFGLRDPQPQQVQALRQAATRARAQAEAIAAGLNVRLGAVLSAEEGAAVRPMPAAQEMFAARAAVSVEPGTVSVRATVTLELEIAP